MQQQITEMAPPVARQNLPTDNLVPNDYNPNLMDKDDYERIFQFMKIVKREPHDLRVRCINPLGSDHLKHKHEIIDGYTRWDIATKLGIRVLECEVYQVSDLVAKSMCYQANKFRGTPRPFREAAFFYLTLKDLPVNRRTAHELSTALNQNEDYIESRLLLWTVAPVARKLGGEDALPIAIWEELAKSVRVESDLFYVEQAANIILPNAKDYFSGNVRNLIASLRRQEQKDQDVLKEAVNKAGKTEETLMDKTPRPKVQPPLPTKGKPLKSVGQRRSEQKPVQQDKRSEEPLKSEEPKPAMVLSSSCYMCGAEDEIAIWTRSGTDRDVIKVVNRAKLKSFEKNLVQERSGTPGAAADVKKERVLVSRQ